MKTEIMIAKIRRELRKHIDKEYREGELRCFKEKINPYGVRQSDAQKIARSVDEELEGKADFNQLLSLAEQLQKDGWMEEQMLAGYLIYRHREEFIKGTFLIFERWVDKYVDNWANCDNL